MSSEAKPKSAYKYVFYDPEGKICGAHAFCHLKRAKSLPWLARPHMSVMFAGSRTETVKMARFATEREAALFVDKWMIEKGRQPVNILKAKACP